MKKLKPENDIINLSDLIGQKINSHIIRNDKSRKDNKQKNLELCQVGKLLGTFFNEFEITHVCEKPDFIISNGKEIIGLEHELIIDSKAKSEEGFYENICEKVEAILSCDPSVPNFLVNLYLQDNLSFKIKDKSDIINKLTELVRTFVLTDELAENDIVRNANKMRHSRKSVCPNFGGYMQKQITEDLILKFISKKEDKIESYRQNSVKTQWLVLVIGSTGHSSYELNQMFKIKLETKFDKVFLYEDFNNNLFKLK